MNLAVTIGYKSGKPVLLTGPDLPIQDQLASAKILAISGGDGKHDCIEVWNRTNGLIKQYRFKKQIAPASKPEPQINQEETDVDSSDVISSSKKSRKK